MERTEKDDGTLFVLKKSHDYHEKFFKENDVDSKSDWYKFNDEEKEKLLKKFENVRVTGPPGSLFLWDSRTFHAPVTPLKDSNRRLVVYVCMAPAQWATANQLKKKRKPSKNIDQHHIGRSNPCCFKNHEHMEMKTKNFHISKLNEIELKVKICCCWVDANRIPQTDCWVGRNRKFHI